MSRQNRFTQSDVTRAIKGAIKAGIDRPRVEIDRAGCLIIAADAGPAIAPAEPEARNPWDDAV